MTKKEFIERLQRENARRSREGIERLTEAEAKAQYKKHNITVKD